MDDPLKTFILELEAARTELEHRRRSVGQLEAYIGELLTKIRSLDPTFEVSDE
jgi:hypothetical protein